MGYMGESASKWLVYASQNEMNVMLNDLNAKNNQYSVANFTYMSTFPNPGSRMCGLGIGFVVIEIMPWKGNLIRRSLTQSRGQKISDHLYLCIQEDNK